MTVGSGDRQSAVLLKTRCFGSSLQKIVIAHGNESARIGKGTAVDTDLNLAVQELIMIMFPL